MHTFVRTERCTYISWIHPIMGLSCIHVHTRTYMHPHTQIKQYTYVHKKRTRLLSIKAKSSSACQNGVRSSDSCWSKFSNLGAARAYSDSLLNEANATVRTLPRFYAYAQNISKTMHRVHFKSLKKKRAPSVTLFKFSKFIPD